MVEMFTYVSPFGFTRHPVNFVRFEGQKGHLYRASNGHRDAPRRLLGTDIVDRFDDVSPLQNHHEGPYDAACAVQNNCGQSSPVAVLRVEIPKVDDSLHEGSNVMTELDMGFMWDPKMASFHPPTLSRPDQTLLIMKCHNRSSLASTLPTIRSTRTGAGL
ncbi:hypothetical protein V8E54_008723 [Elaphomyces granulatus]